MSLGMSWHIMCKPGLGKVDWIATFSGLYCAAAKLAAGAAQEKS
jgi:hypothetical protein